MYRLHVAPALGVAMVVAFSHTSFAQWNIKIPLTVTQGVNIAVDTFGLAASATRCIDVTLGESELPPRPPTGVFDVRFIDYRDPPCLGQGVRLNLQPICIDTFQLYFQKGDGAYNFRLSWPRDIGNTLYSVLLTDALGLGLVNVDMRIDTTVTITPTFITAVNIVIDPCSECGPCIDAVSSDPVHLPASYMLSHNYPNPFNPSTTISYTLPAQSLVTLKVFNVLGQEVATLVNGIESPGSKSVQFDGSSLPSGAYFYRLQAGSYSATKMLMIVK